MIPRSLLGTVVPASILALAIGCGLHAEEEGEGLEQGTSAIGESTIAPDPPAPQLLDPTTLGGYKAALPKFASPRLTRVIASPSTMWFDKQVMIPSYQDSVGDGANTPIGARANSQGRAVIVPQGKRLFSDDGKTWAFPFAHTAGTDASTNAVIVNFLYLPQQNGQLLPVVTKKIDNAGGLGGLGVHKWTWLFPKGAILGEMIFVRAPDGALVPSELRTRERYTTGWAINVFRPFPTAESLSAAIKARRADWASRPALQAVITHLDGAPLQAKTVTSPAFNNVFQVTGAVDNMPDLGEPALVRELLTQTTFVSAYGDTFRTAGGQKTFAAGTTSTFSVVPNGYDAGLLEVREQSCMRCHKDAGRSINDFEPQAVLYGDIWGEDAIFSFHPYDQTQYSNFNSENRRIRPALASIVVPFNAAQHPASIYAPLAP